MTNISIVLPGKVDEGIQFFVHADEIEAPNSGAGIYWPDVPLAVIQLLIEEINKDKKLKMRLMDMFPNSIYERLGEYVFSRNNNPRYSPLDLNPSRLVT